MEAKRRQSWFGRLVPRRPSAKVSGTEKGFRQAAMLPDSGLLSLPPEIWQMIDVDLDKSSLCSLSATCQYLYHLCSNHRLRECKIQFGFHSIIIKDSNKTLISKRPWFRPDSVHQFRSNVSDDRPPVHNDPLNALNAAFDSPGQTAMLSRIRELSIVDLPDHKHGAFSEDPRIQTQMDFLIKIIETTKLLEKVVWNFSLAMPLDVLHAIESCHPTCRLDLQRTGISRLMKADETRLARALCKSTILEAVTILVRGYGHVPDSDFAFDCNVQHAPNLRTIRYVGDSRAYVQFARDEEDPKKKYIDAIKLDIYSPPLPGDLFWQYLNFCKIRLLDTLSSNWSIGTFNPTYFDSLTHIGANIRDAGDEMVLRHLLSHCKIEAMALKTPLWSRADPPGALSMPKILSLHSPHLRYLSHNSRLRYLALDQTIGVRDLPHLGAMFPSLRFLSLEEANVFEEPQLYTAVSSMKQLLYFRIQTNCSPLTNSEALRFCDSEKFDAKDLIPKLYSFLTETESEQRLRKLAIRVEFVGNGTRAYDQDTTCCVLNTQAIRAGATVEDSMHIGYDLINDTQSVGLPLLDVGDEHPMILYKQPYRYRGGCL